MLNLVSSSEDQIDHNNDRAEVSWLIEELRFKIAETSLVNKEITSILRANANELERLLHVADWSFEQFIYMKYRIRISLKLAAGLLTAADWQSPAYEDGIEHGLQSERGTYLRSNGSDYVKTYQEQYLNELFDIPSRYRSRLKGFVTCSGMKALEAALYMYKLTMRSHGDTDFPVYIQKGSYYESVAICSFIFDHAEVLTNDQIYEKLQAKEEIGCLLLDPGTLWPALDGIHLCRVFELLKKRRGSAPFFVIIDRTTTSITNQPFAHFLDDSPSNLILIVIESAMKYNQYGLDLCNQGFLAIYGNLMRHQKYSNLLIDIMNITTAFPSPTSLHALPAPNRAIMTNRLLRLTRNSEILYRELAPLADRGDIRVLFRAIETDEFRSSNDTPWTGGYVILQLNRCKRKDECEAFIREFSRQHKDIFIYSGGSFGFDTTRFTVLEDLSDLENCAIRISAGRDPFSIAQYKASIIRRYLEQKRCL